MPIALVVDDNQDHANSLAMLLRLRGYQVHVVHAAAAAVQATRQFMPQIALVDIAMPGCDGYWLARRFRRNEELEDMRLIAVSGYSDDPHKDLAKQAGFDAYLVKPYTAAELAAAIAGVLGPATESAAILET
jgi:two-component system CheB/CheR fusion protein